MSFASSGRKQDVSISELSSLLESSASTNQTRNEDEAEQTFSYRLPSASVLGIFATLLLSSVLYTWHSKIPGNASFVQSDSLLNLNGEVVSEQLSLNTLSAKMDHISFPSDFVWGAATSSYQIEGAATEDGRGPTIWDTFCQNSSRIDDGSSGAVACDHYHRFHEDIALMKSLNLKAYRFSIAWTRIYPEGVGKLNPAGLAFYNELIDTLLANDLEPWVTLYHWDLPQALQDKYDGWLGAQIVDDFGDYARTCYAAFGDRVKHWTTINEAWSVAVLGYHDGVKAPGVVNNATIDVYQAGHNLVLAHARAVNIYRNEFALSQHGIVGITNCADFRFPKEDNEIDREAANRAMAFQFAWFTDPFVYGDYPPEMREYIGEDRLPRFTAQQSKELIGTMDFLGVNHYSSQYATMPRKPPTFSGYWADMHVEFSVDPSWRKNDMGWSTNPDGCRGLLEWLAQRYPGVNLVMTENGTAEDEPDKATAIADTGRKKYFENYIRACAQAIESGVPLIGYFAWSLMDNFEWEQGYTKRFGICYVDYETLERTPKSSAIFYSKVIESNGRNHLSSMSTIQPRRKDLLRTRCAHIARITNRYSCVL